MTIAVHVAGIVNVNHVSIVERVMSDTTSELRTEIARIYNRLSKENPKLFKIGYCPRPLQDEIMQLIAAQRQRWEAAARSELFMALIATAETVGALDAHDIERMRQAALDGERGKERI